MTSYFKKENIRNFYFENEKGKRIDCQDFNGHLFLYDVLGLGFEEKNSYQQIGNYFILENNNIVQNVITGNIEFYDNAYDHYKSFVDFILTSNALKLVYIPKLTNRVEYFRDIIISKIPKAEENEFNILTSTIKIECLSLWYEKKETIYDMSRKNDEVRWDFKWNSVFRDYSNREILFENKGHTLAPFQIEISGYVKNPKISIFIDDAIISETTINLEFSEFEKFLFCNRDNEQYIMKEEKNGNRISIIDLLDLNKINFTKLPKGVSKIKISADNEITKGKLTIYQEFKVV